MAPLVLHVSLLKFNFSNIIAGHGLGRLLFATKCGPGVEKAHCLVKIVYCMRTMTRRHITNLVPEVGPRPLLVGKSGLV